MRTDAIYQRQRDRLLDCAAASLLEVYRWAGPRAHGDDLSGAPPAIDPASDDCWGQSATNASMLGAIGPVDLAYLQPPSAPAPPTFPQDDQPDFRALVYPAILSAVNTILIEEVGSSVVAFPSGPAQEIQDDELRAQAEDRDLILERVAAATARDIATIRAVYTRNAEDSPSGTHSARQQKRDDEEGPGSVRLLGVPAPIELGGEPPWPRGVDYADGIGSGVVPDGDEALARMFWRGDLKRTCAASLEDGASALYQLKSRCVEAAQLGGDPESCTACVALAELHIPICNTTPQLPVRDSKCSAVGVAASGLPPWWSDNYARSFDHERLPEPFSRSANPCAPPLHVALQWCTDAPNEEGNPAATARAYLGEYAQIDPVDCGTDPVLGPIVGGPVHWRERTARLLMEAVPTRADWLFPMATAYDYDVDWTPRTPCDVVGHTVTSRDPILQANIAPASSAEFVDWLYASARVPRCGVTQRSFHWNRSCGEVQGVMSPALFDPAGGGSLADVLGIVECNARVKREYAICPAGFACTAGGECVAGGQAPQLLFLQSQPD